MKRPKISGVYKIQSKLKPESFYVGSSCDILHRFGEHKRSYKYSRNGCRKLYNHILKYGIDDMDFTILEECENNREKLLEMEQFYMDSLNPTLNILVTAGSPKNVTVSEETRAKISAANKNRIYGKLTQEHKDNLSKAHLGQIAWNKGIELHYPVWHKGRTGVYNEETLSKMRNSSLGRKQSKETISKKTEKLYKPVIQYDMSGNFIKEWRSISDIKLEVQFKNAHISCCCNGKRKTSNGFIWKFKQINNK